MSRVNRILVVEDHAELAYGLCVNLEIEGYEALIAADGLMALDMIARLKIDLCILDLTLPTLGGIDVLRRMREAGSDIPIIILSGRSDEINRVSALRLGADDYVTKPFSLLELIERVKIRLRYCHFAPEADVETVTIGEAIVDFSTRCVTRPGSELRLRPKELKLLIALLNARGAVVQKDKLLRTVWDYPTGLVETRTVDFHIGTLREKIEDDPAHPKHLLTLRGVGYRLIV
jgi:DNA-binding response OmpR family regulator